MAGQHSHDWLTPWGDDGLTPLDVALHLCDDLERRTAVVRCLLSPTASAASFRAAAGALSRAGEAGGPVFPDLVAACLPLSSRDWQHVPHSCTGLGQVLPASLAYSAAQARRVVARLPAAEAQRLRTAALCLAHAAALPCAPTH